MRERILLIGREVISGREVSRALLEAGFAVTRVEDGVEGLAKVSEIRPDVVVAEDALPGMDGWETCRWLRRLSIAPVVMVGGERSSRALVKALSVGADVYLKKPLSLPELVARVRALVRRHVSGMERLLAEARLFKYLRFGTVEGDADK